MKIHIVTAFIMLLSHVYDEDYYFHGVQVIPHFRHYTPQLLILIPRQHGRFVFRTPCFVAVLQRNVHINILFIYLSNL